MSRPSSQFALPLPPAQEGDPASIVIGSANLAAVEALREPERWLDPAMHEPVMALVDAEGFGRGDDWCPGSDRPVPISVTRLLDAPADDNEEAAIDERLTHLRSEDHHAS